MTVIEALKAVKDDGVLAYREAWKDDPALNDSGIIWNSVWGFYCYWYRNAPVPEDRSDDPRIGVGVGTLTIENILADDWAIEETWKVVKP